jgi:hypothetical protein
MGYPHKEVFDLVINQIAVVAITNEDIGRALKWHKFRIAVFISNEAKGPFADLKGLGILSKWLPSITNLKI